MRIAAFLIPCIFIALVTLSSGNTGGSEVRDIKCETCQTIVYDSFSRFAKRPHSKTTGMSDHAVLGILENACDQIYEYADKADLGAHLMNEQCGEILPKLEEFLEETLPRRGASEAKAREICVKKRYCASLWAAGDEPHHRESKSERNLREGNDYLANNAKKEDVMSLPSGLQYKILTAGVGTINPALVDTVKVHYAGHLTNGDVFDSSYTRGEPAEFPLKGVIKGWTEVLQLMVRGDIWEVVIPGDLAYGPPGGAGGKIGPNAVLVFKIELLEIKGRDPIFSEAGNGDSQQKDDL